MNKFLRNMTAGSSSTSDSQDFPNVVSTGESIWEENDLLHWQPSSICCREIYRKSLIDFKSAYTIKIEAQVLPLFHFNKFYIYFQKNSIIKHLKNGYKLLHIGLVQIAIKPLTREWLDTSVFLTLQDCRHLEFHDSLLGLVETSLCNGQIYFNFFPLILLILF